MTEEDPLLAMEPLENKVEAPERACGAMLATYVHIPRQRCSFGLFAFATVHVVCLRTCSANASNCVGIVRIELTGRRQSESQPNSTLTEAQIVVHGESRIGHTLG